MMKGVLQMRRRRRRRAVNYRFGGAGCEEMLSGDDGKREAAVKRNQKGLSFRKRNISSRQLPRRLSDQSDPYIPL